MRHLDLFSGIGGFALAASWVWPEHEVVAFCDIEPYATKVLNRHWPDVPVINDVRNITKETVSGSIQLITGGFPCQPFSQAGKRKGTDDDRYLWPEMLRVITTFRPRYVLGENVSGIYTIDDGMVFEQVCLDLENAGYEVRPIRIPAAALNAPHRRDRWWFAAYLTDTTSERSSTRRSAKQGRSILPDSKGDDPKSEPQWSGRHGRLVSEHCPSTPDAANIESAHNRNRQRFNDDPEKRKIHESECYHGSGVRCGCAEGDTFTADHAGDTESAGRTRSPNGHGRTDQWSRHWLEAASEFCRVDDGLSDRMDTTERKHRLTALGNAIVPQVAAEIMRHMKNAHEKAAG